jgi:hypothetical protein
VSVPLTAADLDRIEALARAATHGKREVRRDAAGHAIAVDPFLAVDGPDGYECGEDWLAVADPDLSFIAALDPDTVLALVEAARISERARVYLRDLLGHEPTSGEIAVCVSIRCSRPIP